MTEAEVIVINTPALGGEVTRELTKEQFLEELVWRANTFGDDTLENWLRVHDISREEAFSFCDVKDIPALLERVLSAKTPEAPSSDVQGAVQGHKTSEMRIAQLAENADRMSTDELEKAMVTAGMQVPRSTLMR